MGAADFRTFGKGTDARQVFSSLKADADAEYGHQQGYSGHINMKYDFVMAAREPMSLDAARTLAEQLLDDPRFSDKWGPAGCIPVAAASALTTRTERLTVPVDETGWLDPAALVNQHLRLKPGEALQQAQIVSDTFTRKVTTQATEGKAVTRYLVVRAGTLQPINSMRYASQAEARAAMDEHAKRARGKFDNQPTNEGWEVIGLVVRESGGPLVQTTSTITNRKVVVEVVIEQRNISAPIEGYLFFGWAPE